MVRMMLAWIGIAVLGTRYLPAAGSNTSKPDPPPVSQHRALLNRYCVTCHNEKLKTANLMLDKMDVENVSQGAPVWEKVIRKLRTRAMPPAGMPRPDNIAYDSFATYLETELDNSARVSPNPGWPVVHRLNRAEYANAIRDLLALDIDGESLLPTDDSNYGFDNIAEVLSVSPTLLERYMSAAGKISSLAIGEPARPAAETYELPRNYTFPPLNQEDRMSEDLPFGSRGGIAIRHFFPLDAEYVVRIRLQRTFQEYIMGLVEPHQLEVRLDGARIKLFTVGGEHKGKFLFKNDDDRLREAPEQEQYEKTADEGLEVRFPVRAGERLIGVDFLKETSKRESELQSHPEGFAIGSEANHYLGGVPNVNSVTISGPYDAIGLGETPSRRLIFVCRPKASEDEVSCAKKILSTLGRRAYRRPVTESDLQALLSLYNVGRRKADFEAGIRVALRGILGSPEFLFRFESDPASVAPDTAYRISDLELASRLSFFLWSSIPDHQLLDLAERGKLKDSEVLKQQVLRMLRDPRSKALVDNFAGQWLYLRNIHSAAPDPDRFPDFDENLREAFRRETELFFESMLREDHSVLDLLNANYTFVNERLARHYGIPYIYGSHFRRVTLNDENRRGLLGQGSILTVTSYDNRTAPTIRGKWILENILGAPPPPPPPNVPSLAENKDTKTLTMRQRMEQHRANPVCASCHSRMDPLGFALENFDGIGKWRESAEANVPIDSSGALPDGTKFQGPAELRKILLSKPEQFVTTVTEKLLTYALGRGVEYYDEPAIRGIVREAGSSDYRWSSLILGIVKSAPFQMRRSGEPATAAGVR